MENWRAYIVSDLDTYRKQLYIKRNIDSLHSEFVTLENGHLTITKRNRNDGSAEPMKPFMTAPFDWFDEIITAIVNDYGDVFKSKEQESKKDGQLEELRKHTDTLHGITYALMGVIADRKVDKPETK